ncbi:MAG: hypothetical protein V4684_14455 [Pseudomonadota bacterium]
MSEAEAVALRTRHVASVLVKAIRDDLIFKGNPQAAMALGGIEKVLLDRYAPLPTPVQSPRLEYQRRLRSELNGIEYRQAVQATASIRPALKTREVELICYWEAAFQALKAVRSSCLLRGDQDGLRTLEVEVFRESDRDLLPGPVALRIQGLTLEYAYCHRLRMACRKILHDLHTSEVQANPLSEEEFERLAARNLERVKRQILGDIQREPTGHLERQQALGPGA